MSTKPDMTITTNTEVQGNAPSATASNPNSTPLQQLKLREREIEQYLQTLDRNQAQIAIAEHLYVIDNEKLYVAAGFKSFRAYVATRFPHRKSRLYQLRAFGQGRQEAMEAGTPMPVNERQFRRTATRPRPRANSDPFAQFWHPIFKYLQKKCRACPAVHLKRVPEMLELYARFVRARIPAAHPNDDDHTPGPERGASEASCVGTLTRSAQPANRPHLCAGVNG